MKKEEWPIYLVPVQLAGKFRDLKKFFHNRLWVITGEILTLNWLPQSILAIIQGAHNSFTPPERLFYLQGLKKKIEEELCSDVLGLDLIRGELLYTRDSLTPFHFQVFGKDKFLRNIFQRVLKDDANQRVPIIIFAPDKELDLPKQAFKVLPDNAVAEPCSFFNYASSQLESPLDFLDRVDLFKVGNPKFIYARLSRKGSAVDQQLLSVLEMEIMKKLDSKRSSLIEINRLLIYVFRPELLESGYSITQYAKRLKDHATFRIFSKETLVFGRDESSLLYGPDHSFQQPCEVWREHCYQQFQRKRKRQEQHGFFRPKESQEDLKVAEVFANRTPIDQTAFGCFNIGESTYEYAWFDPVRQGLGKKSWCRTSQMPVIQMNYPSPIKAKRPAEDPLTLKIIADLKPKEAA